MHRLVLKIGFQLNRLSIGRIRAKGLFQRSFPVTIRGGCNSTMLCFESDGIHASRIEFKSAYLDLKKGLLLSLIAVPISDCALTNANANLSLLIIVTSFLAPNCADSFSL